MSTSTIDTFAPLSLAQERFLLVNRLVGDVPLHNLPVGWRIRGPLNVEVLSRALGYLAQRHLVLRTRFPTLADGSAVQEIRPEWQPELEIVSIPDGPDHARAESLRAWKEATTTRPFTLAEEPAFRASVARLASEEHVLLLVFHHIAFDGWSFGVVVRDLGAAYTAFENGREPDLTPLPLQYADYAIAQREWVKGEEAERQRARWAKILEGVPTELEIPSDRQRSASPSFRVERFRHVLPAEFRSVLEEFSKATRATPFMILMAALQALLGRYTGRSDFLIGFPLANRQDRADLSALVGCFINILILRADLSGEPSFVDLVRRVRRAAFEAFPYQKLPFDEVVKIVRPDRSLSQIIFNYRDYANPPLRLADLDCEDLDYDPGMSAVDLSLDVIAFHAGALVLEIEYSLDLFDRITVERFAGHFERLLREAIAAPERPVSELPFPSAEARHAVSIDRSAGDPGLTPRHAMKRVPARSAATPRLITDIERVLLPIWQESLGVTEIGTREDFFELGGQSLMAVHLVAEAERQLGGTIPLGWIFEHPTVEQLAAAIDARPPQVARGPEFLIPIRASGTLPPLFCIHGLAGGVFAYREVAKLLGLEQPVYGIMLVGRPVERIPRSVEAMAERYIDEMRSVQAHGPYRVLGYSFGCLVAYEMARQLEANGEMVDLVGLVAPPRKLPALRPVWRLLRRRAIHARSQRALSINSICMSATYSYRPLPYAGRIVFFRAEGAGSGGERLWSRLAAGRLEVRRVPGDHLTIMRSHNAPEFARELRLALGIPASETG